MSRLQVLDCTLRDGGFVNDWMFGRGAIINIVKRLSNAGVEILEMGMMNESKEFSVDRTIVPHSSYLNDVFEYCDLSGDFMKVGMVILGECPIENICDCKDSVLDGIRIVFKNVDVDAGLKYAKQLKEKGYIVFIQPASVTDYEEEELKQMLHRANELEPYAVYIVDTYGLVSKKELFRIFDIFDENLDEDIWVGYHAHNNYNAANANASDLVDYSTKRKVIIDSTVYGIGKNAGNTLTELLCEDLNINYDKKYDMSQFMEIINGNIIPIQKQNNWGYELKHFISASNKCHPKYVNYLMAKNTLTMEAINQILSRIAPKIKTTYVEAEITKLYNQFLLNDIDDSADIEQLKKDISSKNILLLGPGKSIQREREKIQKYIEENNSTVISLNHVSDKFKIDYVFVSNDKRYDQVFSVLQSMPMKPRVILTSNIHESFCHYDYMLSFDSFLCANEKISTNAGIVMFNLLIQLGIDHVDIAGFDGYSYSKDENYKDKYSNFDQEIEPNVLNDMIKKEILSIKDRLQINFITDSLYNR